MTTPPQPWQPLTPETLNEIEAFVTNRRTEASFFSADALHLVNYVLHMVREIRATRGLPSTRWYCSQCQVESPVAVCMECDGVI